MKAQFFFSFESYASQKSIRFEGEKPQTLRLAGSNIKGNFQ